MAYMNQAKKQELAPQIKTVLKKHGMKGSISVRGYSTLIVKVKRNDAVIDFFDTARINTFWIESHFKDNPRAKDFLLELKDAMNDGNHDNSDIMTDYFDVGWYIDIVLDD